jgi:hypothetical protein
MQTVQATSSVAESPTVTTNQSSPLSAQPSSVGQRTVRVPITPSKSQPVLTMESIARATNQEEQVWHDVSGRCKEAF